MVCKNPRRLLTSLTCSGCPTVAAEVVRARAEAPGESTKEHTGRRWHLLRPSTCPAQPASMAHFVNVIRKQVRSFVIVMQGGWPATWCLLLAYCCAKGAPPSPAAEGK